MTKSSKLDFSRLNQGQVAEACGVTPGAVRAWRCPRNSDSTYSLPAVIAWRVAEAERKAAARASSDPLLVGPGDSVNLERYRGVKADLATLELEQKRGEVVDVSAMRTWIAEAGSAYRGFCDRVQKDLPKDISTQIIRWYEDATAEWYRALLPLDEIAADVPACGDNGTPVV